MFHLKALKFSSVPCGSPPKVGGACKCLSAAGPRSHVLTLPQISASSRAQGVGHSLQCWVMASTETGKVFLFAACVLQSLLQATALSSVQIQHVQPDPCGTRAKSQTHPGTGCVNIQASPPAAEVLCPAFGTSPCT